MDVFLSVGFLSAPLLLAAPEVGFLGAPLLLAAPEDDLPPDRVPDLPSGRVPALLSERDLGSLSERIPDLPSGRDDAFVFARVDVPPFEREVGFPDALVVSPFAGGRIRQRGS